MTTEYIGKFSWQHGTENRTRTWFVWATSDDEGNIITINLGISENLLCASTQLHRNNCVFPHQKYAFAFAEQELTTGLIWDTPEEDEGCEVIDLNDRRPPRLQ